MDYKQRMDLVRLYGPRRPLLRHVLLVLALYDTVEGGVVFGGRLELETGYSDRAIRQALRELVLLGWLKPLKEFRPSDPRLVSSNQYGEAAAPRVHGHLGGCRAGGGGCKTHYVITYRHTPCAELPRGRKVGKGERGAAVEGGTGRRTPLPHPPHPNTGKGEAGAGKGEAGAAEPGTGLPLSERDRRDESDAGGYPPRTPGEVESGPPYGGPGSRLPADAGDCPQDSCPPADAGDCPQDQKSSQRGGRQLAARWSDVLTTVSARRPQDPGIRLWLQTPRVEPTHITADVAHIRVPTQLWAQSLDRYAADLAAAISEWVLPVSRVIFHPQESAA